MNDLKFAGYPITLEQINDEIFINCKGLTGTLSQVEEFLSDINNKRHYFGKAKIRRWRNAQIRIDCLIDDYSQFIYLYEQVKQFKNGQN